LIGFVILAGSCKDINISAASISERTVQHVRAKQKWVNLHAELQDGQWHTSKVVV